MRRVVAIAGRVALLAVALSLVLVCVLRWIDPATTAFMMERRVASLFDDRRHPGIRYQWADWEGISPSMRLAVVAAEDQKFPRHHGFDFESITDAMADEGRGGRTRGASTITQQVAKNLFLWPGRSYVRKGLEAYFTVLIEVLWPKRRILEVYLNIVEFGDGAYGVGAASRRLWRKPPSRLTWTDAALLAAVLPNPSRFDASRPSRYVERRALWIQFQMMLLGPDYLSSM